MDLTDATALEPTNWTVRKPGEEGSWTTVTEFPESVIVETGIAYFLVKYHVTMVTVKGVPAEI
jgi:hypothetical protein